VSQALKSIIARELKRIFTDRRIVITLFLVPALSIGIIYSVMGYLSMNFIKDVEAHVSTYVISDAPESFKVFLTQNPDLTEGVELTYVSGETVDTYAPSIKGGSLDMFARFSDDFDTRIESVESASVYTYYNYGEDYSEASFHHFVNDVLDAYRNEILTARFENPNAIMAFKVEDLSETAETVNEDKASGKILSTIIPMLISIFLFAGAMSVVMDSIAGEKERGTLATLLVTPVKREAIAIGKMISHGIIATLSALSSIAGMLLTLGILMLFMPNELDIGVSLGYSALDIVYLIGLVIMLVGIYVGIISLLSALSKNVKEAGTYMTPVYMFIMVVSFLNMYAFNAEPIWKYAIPIYGQIVGLKEIFMYQITPVKFFVAFANAAVTWTVLVLWIRNLFNNEKVIFTSS
jgi:sodium transport system permease protein